MLSRSSCFIPGHRRTREAILQPLEWDFAPSCLLRQSCTHVACPDDDSSQTIQCRFNPTHFCLLNIWLNLCRRALAWIITGPSQRALTARSEEQKRPLPSIHSAFAERFTAHSEIGDRLRVRRSQNTDQRHQYPIVKTNSGSPWSMPCK